MSMLGREVTPILTYVDKGLDAVDFEGRTPLVGGESASPAAALKIARQSLYRPTALIHEPDH